MSMGSLPNLPFPTGSTTDVLRGNMSFGPATADGNWARVLLSMGGFGLGVLPNQSLYSSSIAAARVETDETQAASAGFADLATAGPSVTLTMSGTVAYVWCSAVAYRTGGAGNSALLGVAVSGSSTVAASAVTQTSSAGASITASLSTSFLLTGLTPGSNTFKLQYKNDGGTNWHFLDRAITVIAL